MLLKEEPKKSQPFVIGCVIIYPCDSMPGRLIRLHKWLKQDSGARFVPSLLSRHSPLSSLGEGGTLHGLKHSFTQERKARSAVSLSFDQFQLGYMPFDHPVI